MPLRLPMYFFYRILTAAGMFLLAPYYALRGWRRGEPSSALRERLGSVPPEIIARAAASRAADGLAPGAIWIHAVSVGEVLAAKPLAEGLRRRFPGQAVFVSTTTETGQRLARERLQSVDGIFYFPLDWIVPVRRALRSIHPALVIVMETEIWPNFLREARRLGIPVIFANARISERSFARFKHWEFLIGEFFKQTLQDAELFLAQTPEDAVRLREMGAPDERVEVTGNLKYDGEPPAASRFGAWLEDQIRAQERWPVFVAGSVVAEEEE
ncbi:MAG: glycosyltransferase N-terminal domain-containing protein, partial [Candidatus Acidiferrales bacterium]